jgi:hypothetical protein
MLTIRKCQACSSLVTPLALIALALLAGLVALAVG